MDRKYSFWGMDLELVEANHWLIRRIFHHVPDCEVFGVQIF